MPFSGSANPAPVENEAAAGARPAARNRAAPVAGGARRRAARNRLVEARRQEAGDSGEFCATICVVFVVKIVCATDDLMWNDFFICGK